MPVKSLTSVALKFVACAAVLLLSACEPRPERLFIGEPRGEQYAARGRELYKGLATCGHCHNEQPDPSALPSGGQVRWDRYGEVPAPNLTPAAAGIGGWSASDVMRAVRSSIGKDGRRLSEEMHQGYEWMADDDLLSIVAYLKGVPPVERAVPRREVPRTARYLLGFWEPHDEQAGYVPQIDRRYQLEYGKYLVDHVARCSGCHSKPANLISDAVYLGGGKLIIMPSGEKYAPGLGSSRIDGLGAWTEGDIVRYLKTGATPEGQIADSDFCPVNFFANGSERDLAAVAKYLKSLP